MIPAFLAALMALGTLNAPDIKQKHNIKPCDAQTGCLHPNFK